MISFFTSVTSSNLESPKTGVTTSPVMPSGGADSESEVIQASEASLDEGGCWEGVRKGVKAGAAAEHFVEGLAEVSEAGIADFETGLGDVAFAGAQEVGGALEAGAAEPLGEGEAGLAGGGAAEVEVAAGDAAAKFFEGGGFGQVFQEDGLDPSDALSGEPLGTSATPQPRGCRIANRHILCEPRKRSPRHPLRFPGRRLCSARWVAGTERSPRQDLDRSSHRGQIAWRASVASCSPRPP
jgi:hypothetical protein